MSLNITIPNPRVGDLARARDLMEHHLEEVKRVTDSIRTRHAKAALKEQFPGYAVAVFARTWETDEYYLMQLIAAAQPATKACADINFDEDGGSGLTVVQKDAVRIAEAAICAIGSDHDIWEHLEMADDEHDGWYEFDLVLDDGTDLTGVPAPAAENDNARETQ